MKRTTRAQCATLAAALMLAVVGCANSASEPGTGKSGDQAVPAPNKVGAPEKKEVVVQGASPTPNIGYLPLYVGQSKGFFSDEGISVKVNYSHGDAAPLQAISTGQAQVMSGTPEELIRGYQKGLHGVLFYQTYKKLIFSVAARTNSNIKRPIDLQGKTIGVSSVSSTGVLIAKALLAEAGGDPSTLKFLPVGTGQQALGAFRSGKVDALALWDTPYSQLETAGAHLTYWQPKSLSKVGDGGYFTSWDLIKQQPNTLARFTRGIAKSMRAIHDDPEGALKAYWKVNPSARPKGSDQEALKASLQQLKTVGKSLDMSGDPKEVDKSSLKTYMETFKKQDMIKENPPVDQIVTNAFVPIAKDAVEK